MFLIPNRAVKPSRADGTAGATLWESRLKVRLSTDRCRIFYFGVLGAGF